MSSIICQTFVGNAWRSDLCSNCFKCLEDHSNSVSGKPTYDRITTSATQRYMPQATSLYQSRGISTSLKWRLSEPIYERVARRDFGSQTPPKTSHSEPEQSNEDKRVSGILIKRSTQQKKQRSHSSVDFASEEALVIGYGGNDYDSDQSPWEMGSDDGSIDIDLLDDTDEDRKISRLTRNNTEFNSSNQNLLTGSPEVSKSKYEVEKLNSINNSKNSPQKAQDKALSIFTYNDIQPQMVDKQLNQYYFSANMKSYLQNGNVTVKNVNETNNTGLSPINNLKFETDNKTILVNEFTPLNTRTYSFVSEISKNATSSEHSSDSDYSTCRLTPGDSTDSSESFQDAEDVKVLPCSSFLHGKSFSTEQPSLDSLESDKKYDEESSTSGDISNLSDDSDTNEKTYKTSRNVRTTKGSQNEKRRPNSEVVQVTHDKKEYSSTSILKPTLEENETDAYDKPGRAVSTKTILKQNDTQMSCISLKVTPEKPSNGDIQNTTNSGGTKQELDTKHNHSPAPKPPLDVNLGNIIAVNGCSTSSKEESFFKTTQPYTAVVLKVDNDIQRTNSSETMTDKEKKNISNSYHKAAKPKKEVSFEKEPSDDDDSATDYEKSPDAISNRQSKLAALALELELARRDSEMKSLNANAPPSIPLAPPEVKSKSPATTENFSTIKKGGIVSCASRLHNILPDVLQETPVKAKKSRFSLKKLLKRNKDSGTFTPTGKDVNPKAWKKQTFDRSRLSLEIVHPMDLQSGDCNPIDENVYMVSGNPGRGGIFKSGYSRARSLSALPQLSSGEFLEDSNCSLLECRKMDTLPARKAGTVAERKKNRPSLVRTPSCSALPCRPGVTPTAGQSPSERVPPPKPPPPPPKCKVMHPPPPPPPPSTHPRAVRTSSTPARPPPPQIPETKSRTTIENPGGEMLQYSSIDKEYANLGDIRSQLTPLKPFRPSALCGPAHRGDESSCRREDSDTYETLQPTQEEEDHYTYLDETAQDKKLKSTPVKSNDEDCNKNSKNTPTGRPWLDLQTSYAAIAAANYESLAEIVTTTLNEEKECFRNLPQPLRWKDFNIDSNEPPLQLAKRKAYSATYLPKDQEKVTLVIIPRKPSSPQNVRSPTRYPVLASFADNNESNNTVYVLPQCHLVTVSQFSLKSSQDKSDQHIHLRNQCFILLQLIHSLKSVQAEGIEEIGFDLDYLLLVLTHEERPPVFVLFPEDKSHLCDSGVERKTLCQAALATMFHFLKVNTFEEISTCNVNSEPLAEPVAHTFRAIAKILQEEKASSLSQAKGLLEYMLWGPVDLNSQVTGHLDEVLGRWLDLQRAQMVKSTISQLQLKQRLQVYEEYQLVFLLQASVKSLKSVISNL